MHRCTCAFIVRGLCRRSASSTPLGIRMEFKFGIAILATRRNNVPRFFPPFLHFHSLYFCQSDSARLFNPAYEMGSRGSLFEERCFNRACHDDETSDLFFFKLPSHCRCHVSMLHRAYRSNRNFLQFSIASSWLCHLSQNVWNQSVKNKREIDWLNARKLIESEKGRKYQLLPR